MSSTVRTPAEAEGVAVEHILCGWMVRSDSMAHMIDPLMHHRVSLLRMTMRAR